MSEFSGVRAPETTIVARCREHEQSVMQSREMLARAVEETCAELGGFGDAVVEFGCGHGHFLGAYAKRHAESACVGVDFCRERIRRAQRKLERAGLGNLRFVHAEAAEFIRVLPGTLSFSRVFVMFPDPWPKRRHRKNRFFSLEFLAMLTPACRPGCALYFRSDSADYVREARAIMASHPLWQLDADNAWPFEHTTVFQDKARTFESLVAVRNA